ncbi:RNA pseudouridine synthase [Jeotgalibacillus malaysiensis]|uniref:Pseudouridine synthase n=1 Tax=Jeotgalibacillus malaysiensis TaxID=1508404 RepID=A0A0B5AX69_9BACL|nr:pseudouridine synthase [Jeotgalibacillus malaysiensis]AJD92619.1 RNA pseudouridine synthase [Jeotgalibacillus malaysiensis]
MQHIQTVLAKSGAYSRRETGRMIEQKRVTVNGVTCTHSTEVLPEDEILIDGKPLPEPAERIYLAFHKPAGITCTAQQKVEGNLVDYLNFNTRIFAVGRLDKASTGLLLLTNDGSIVNPLMKEAADKEKEYLVETKRPVSDEMIAKMRAGGLLIKGKAASPAFAEKTGEYTFRIILKQGLNRQIRRMCSAFGNHVTSLKRVRISHIHLGSLPAGEWRHLNLEEIHLLKVGVNDQN